MAHYCRPRVRRLVAGVLALIGLVSASSASADIGVVGVKPSEGQAAEPVELSIACGACLATSVVNGPRHPAVAFPVSLVPVDQVPRLRSCARSRFCDGSGKASPDSLGPPRRRPFVFLGRARPTFREQELEGMRGFPEYRLRFRIPTVRPGLYAFVIYCGGCYPGRSGSLIVDPPAPPGEHTPLYSQKGRLIRPLLRVRQAEVGELADGTAAGPWIAVGAGAAAVGLGGALLLGRRRPRNRIFG
jgi:hypothetical protein